jgi:long-chain acyl-CoA synthetase
VVRNVKKMVPAWELPTRALQRRAGRRPAHELKPVSTGPTTSPSCSTPAAPPACRRARRCCTEHIANVLQSEAWMQPALAGAHIDQVSRHALPLYHIFALTVCCLLGMRSGGLSILIPNPRDIPGFIKELQKYKFNMFPAVNTLYNALLNHPDFAKLDSRAARGNGGGMAVQEAVAELAGQAGCPIIEGYGLSETSPSATCNPTDTDAFSAPSACRCRRPKCRSATTTATNCRSASRRICLRGPAGDGRLLEPPRRDRQGHDPDGFFKTGDIGVMDERGYTKIVDRKKDMILVSGFNVYPNEVEGVVAECPGVLEVAAVGVPDQHSGEVVKLFVVKDPA